MKKLWSTYVIALFFTMRFYTAVVACAILFVARFFLPWLGIIPYLALLVFVVLLVADYMVLFFHPVGIVAERSHAQRFSNGDENPISILIRNNYSFSIQVEVIDEMPYQFQRRDVLFTAKIPQGQQSHISYSLRPVKRGEYQFGNLQVYPAGFFGLVRRRYTFKQPVDVPVYPSYIQMRKYQLMAISNRLSEVGVKKVRRLGHSMEFEQIKEYVPGDDYRTLNWKASARRGSFMVNNFTDEKSQQVYCIIDKGRAMKMPFEGLSLLDYAINASLVLCNVALLKEDKAGLITFSEKMGAFLPANKTAAQMQQVLEVLYKQKTRYLESDYEQLYVHLRRRVSQRSLIVLFTNFESLSGMRRQLPYLRKIATHHLVVAVFFENTELKEILEIPANSIPEVYTKTIAEKFAFEKRVIAKELEQHGILTILTPPQQLTINTINKYLELKARQSI